MARRSAVCSLMLLAVLVAASQPVVQAGGRQSTVAFLRGSITPSRRLLSTSLPDASATAPRVGGRRLAAAASDSREVVWLVGVPEANVADVKRGIEAMNGKLLHTVNGHWLVRATQAAVKTLMRTHPELTAAEYPPDFKLSTAVVQLLKSMSDLARWGISSPTPKDLPEDVRSFLHQTGRLAGTPEDQQGSSVAARHHVELIGLVPESTQQAVQLLASRLEAMLRWQVARQLSGSETCVVSVTSSAHAVKAVVCLPHVAVASSLLAEQPEVTWVQLDPASYKQQDLQAVAAIQGAALISSSYPAPDVSLGVVTPYYGLWRAGLTGSNQVVGVIDSGLDMDSCFVWDPNYPSYGNDSTQGTVFATASVPPFNEIRRPIMFYSVDGHRKVLMYSFEQDSVDAVRGHGTHIITSIVGSPFQNNPDATIPEQNYGQGVAYDAKVAFIDVGQTRQDGSGGGLYINALALGNQYLTLKQAQAYVTCNSWGTEAFANSDNACYTINMFAYSEQNTLHVFPSGNNERALDDSLLSSGTVNNPGICSNGLTVGATENFIPDGVTDADIALSSNNNQEGTTLEVDQFMGPEAPGTTQFTIGDVSRNFTLDTYPGLLSSMSAMGDDDFKVVQADPLDACSELSNDQEDKVIVFVQRTRDSACSISDTINNVYAWSKSGGAIIADQRGRQTPTLDVTINGFPVAYASTTPAAYLRTQLLTGNGTLRVTWFAPSGTGLPPFENVARFSGFGSARSFEADRSDRSARIKPDIVAPGYILAGLADGAYAAQQDQCMTTVLAGTSMAAAQVSGAALMVRQYFLEGYYPTGQSQQRNIHFPSGPLIKGVLIAGAAAMKGVSRINSERLDPPPSQFQGYGRVDLTTALPLAGGPTDYKLQVIDRASFNSTGSQVSYVIDHSFEDAEKPIIVVLTYYDYPAYPGAPNLIVNDLDVVVRGPLEAAKPQVYYPNGLTKADPVNNVEKIVIESAPKGSYRITVTATGLSPLAPVQQYSLVVLGGVSNTIYDDFNPAVVPQPTEPDGTPSPTFAAPPPATTDPFAPATPSTFTDFTPPPFPDFGR